MNDDNQECESSVHPARPHYYVDISVPAKKPIAAPSIIYTVDRDLAVSAPLAVAFDTTHGAFLQEAEWF